MKTQKIKWLKSILPVWHFDFTSKFGYGSRKNDKVLYSATTAYCE